MPSETTSTYFWNGTVSDELAAVYEMALAYLNGRTTRRMAAEEAGLDPYEGVVITDAVESVIKEMRGADPYLDSEG